jgi:hypothetical protein
MREAPRRGVPSPVRQRRWWIACAALAVFGTMAAALAPAPWSVLCGALAALGAIGAFGLFVAITVLEQEGED